MTLGLHEEGCRTCRRAEVVGQLCTVGLGIVHPRLLKRGVVATPAELLEGKWQRAAWGGKTMRELTAEVWPSLDEIGKWPLVKVSRERLAAIFDDSLGPIKPGTVRMERP